MAPVKHRRFRTASVALCALGLLICLMIGVPIGRALEQQSLNRKLIVAIRHNNTRAVIDLLRQGADANCHADADRPISPWQTLLSRLGGKPISSPPTLTALLLATRPRADFDDLLDADDHPENTLDNVAMIRALLEHNADPNARDPQGFTALLYAIRWQKYAAVDLLLTHGADPDQGDKNHETPLMVAIYMTDPQATRLLLDHGAHPDRKEDVTGQTALVLALTLRRTALIPLLMAHHPDLTLRDYNGKNALEYGHELGYTALLKQP